MNIGTWWHNYGIIIILKWCCMKTLPQHQTLVTLSSNNAKCLKYILKIQQWGKIMYFALFGKISIMQTKRNDAKLGRDVLLLSPKTSPVTVISCLQTFGIHVHKMNWYIFMPYSPITFYFLLGLKMDFDFPETFWVQVTLTINQFPIDLEMFRSNWWIAGIFGGTENSFQFGTCLLVTATFRIRGSFKQLVTFVHILFELNG
jgi:hypothetical protein